MKTVWVICWTIIAFAVPSVTTADGPATDQRMPDKGPDGWTAESPRDEIRPDFSYEPNGGPNGTGCFVMSVKGQSENMGRWTNTFPVTGGQHFSFRALRKANGMENPRRNTMVRITWQNGQGELVPMGPGKHLLLKTSTIQLSQAQDNTPSQEEEKQTPPTQSWLKKARYEFPADRSISAEGWTEVADIYLIPPDATQAKIELCLRWSRSGEVRWSEVSLEEVTPPENRTVRLATVNLHLGGQSNRQLTAMDACRMHAGLIAEAATQKADIVCLTEQLVAKGTGKSSREIAEPIPGPSTDYFGVLAKKHDLYIVVGLAERDGPHLYNTAVLVGPDGTVVGKYRKVCLTRGESVLGLTAGREFPVFETRFGKVGMMICWDLMFPECARSLSNHGAEVIAMPIAGGDPLLARARAIENQVYLVTSSNGGHGLECGVFGYDGALLGEATDPHGSVCVVEVDLNERQYWHWLGNLKNEIPRVRP